MHKDDWILMTYRYIWYLQVGWFKDLQAMGIGFMNQAQKDSHVDNNYKFAINSLQWYEKSYNNLI